MTDMPTPIASQQRAAHGDGRQFAPALLGSVEVACKSDAVAVLECHFSMVNLVAFGKHLISALLQLHFFTFLQDTIVRCVASSRQCASGKGGHPKKNSCSQFFAHTHGISPASKKLVSKEVRVPLFRCFFVYPEQMFMENTYIKYDDIEK